LNTTLTSLLEGGDDFTRGALDIKVDSLATIERTFTMHTNLTAAAINYEFQVVVLVIDLINDVTASPWVFDFSNKFTRSIFDIGD